MDSIVYWVIIGLVVALAAAWLTRDRGRGNIVNVGLGLVGAVAGGFLFNMLLSSPMLGYSPYDMLAAVAGSVVILGLFHVVAGRRPI